MKTWREIYTLKTTLCNLINCIKNQDTVECVSSRVISPSVRMCASIRPIREKSLNFTLISKDQYIYHTYINYFTRFTVVTFGFVSLVYI